MEARSFLPVPLDWDDPVHGEIRVFYRVVGSDPAKPLLVFFNGGPGLPASDYVSLDRKTNTLSDYEASFRLLLIDQRGTGLSSPLDIDSPQFDPQTTVRLFGSRQQARDAAAVISRVLTEQERFFLLAHSYGGKIVFQYLALQGVPKPAAVVLAAPAIPYLDPVRVFLARRLSQRRLNESILGNRPDLQAKVLQLKERIRVERFVDADGTPLLPEMVSSYFRFLNLSPKVPAQVAQWLDRLLQAPIADVNKDLRAKMKNPYNMLLQVLAVTDLFGDSIPHLVTITNAMLERSAAWMFDEGEVYVAVPYLRRGTYRKLIEGLPSLAPFDQTPPLGAVKEALHEIPLLYACAQDDAQLGFDTQKEQFDTLADASKSKFEPIPSGGHGAMLSSNGAALVARWLAPLR
jgi:pimeloyl-ACP methyl ester carboxylesterase